jgi:autotransporter-associated beta strand protein
MPWRKRRFRPRLEPLEARLVLYDHTWSHGSCLLACNDHWSDESNWSNGSPAGDPDPFGAVVIFPEDAGSGWDGNFDEIPGELPVKSLYYHRGGFDTFGGSGDSLVLSQDIYTDLPGTNLVDIPIRFTNLVNPPEHRIEVDETGLLTLTGDLTGDESQILDKYGTGTLLLAGNNQNFAGMIALHEGTLQLGSSDALANVQVTALDAGATLDLNDFNATARFAGSPTLLGDIKLGSGILSFQGYTFADVEGSISGSGGLTVNLGANDLLDLGVHGTFTYTGPTLINTGTLVVDGMSPGSPITITGGGTLGGGGVVGAITAQGGMLHPGTDLVSQGNVVFEPGSSFAVDISGSSPGHYGRLDATGTIDLSSGGTNLVITGALNTAEGDTLTILHSSTGVIGTFAGLSDGTAFTVGHTRFQIHYTGTDVTITHLPQFAPPVYYPVGAYEGNPHALAVGDVNGDGIPDLIVAADGNSVVRVLLGNGDGTFQNSLPAISIYAPIAVALGDFNGDGILDLAVTDNSNLTGTLDILLGNGDGTFQAPVSYSVDYYPKDVLVGDVNGDGAADLVVYSQELNFQGGVSILYGNGDGTFQDAVNYSFPGYTTSAVALGYVNGDGLLDLVVGNTAGTLGSASVVSVLVNEGNDANGHAILYHDMTDDYPIGISVSSLVVADVTNDYGGLDDVLVVADDTAKVGVLLGDGTGTFQSPVISSGVSGEPGAVDMGDFDGSSYPDIVEAINGGSQLAVQYGKGDGSFGPPSYYAVGGGMYGYGVFAVAAADFNGDGAPDLAALTLANGQTSNVGILLNMGYAGGPAPQQDGWSPRHTPQRTDSSTATFLDPAASDDTAAAASAASPSATATPAPSAATVFPADQWFALVGPNDLGAPAADRRLLAVPALEPPFAWEMTRDGWLAEEILPERLGG